MAVVVVSDEPSFLASWVHLAQEAGLLALPTLLLALTSLPLPRLTQLNHLHIIFSQSNAALIVYDGGSPPRLVEQLL